MNRLILAFLVVLLSSGPATAKNTPQRIIGRPLAQASCNVGKGCDYGNIPKSSQAKSEMVISSSGDTYYWTSREGTELDINVSGAFWNFINSKGSGYVKVMNNDEGCLYMEHVNLMFQTITYWGTCEVS